MSRPETGKNEIEKLRHIEGVVEQFNDVIGTEAAFLSRECGVLSSEELRKTLEKLKSEGKLLTIGIVGAVNAGKSSLLNSVLFEGKSVLPKAATPMTAALTVLTYSETLTAVVDYFTLDDLKNIERSHDIYDEMYRPQLRKAKEEIEARLSRRGESLSDADIAKKAEAAAAGVMRESYPEETAYNEQYELMQKSGLNPKTVCTKGSEEINAKSLDELMGRLHEYVGAGGKNMPFTKSVELKLPYENLRDIRVVDTPGINDPVRSREQRTEQYLKECDVIFIISRAGHFLDKQELSLMDRISTKEGVSELFLAASQSDNELFGSEREKAGGDFNLAIENIKNSLSNQAQGILENLLKSNPETKGQFDQLVKDGKNRIIITSGLCSAMHTRFADKSNWDEDMQYVWERLQKYYGAYFSEGESGRQALASLSGVETMREKIAGVREKKDAIIERKEADYITQQTTHIREYQDKLQKAVADKLDAVKNTDIQKLNAEKQELQKRRERCSCAIDEGFDDSFEAFSQNAKSAATQGVRAMINRTSADAEEDIGSETKTWKEKKSGVFSGIARFLWGGGWEERSEQVQTLRSGAVQNKISALISGLETRLYDAIDKAENEWKKSMPRTIIEKYKDALGDDLTLEDSEQLGKAIKNVVNAFSIPAFDFSNMMFSNTRQGTLKGDAVDDYLEEVSAYLNSLEGKYRRSVESTLNEMSGIMKKQKISALVFKNIENQIDELEKNIRNKTFIIERLEKCAKDLKAQAKEA